MISQKGQAVVEFAMILPLFLLFLFGIVYMGMIFADYMSINNMARGCAREASNLSVTEAQYESIGKQYRPEDLPVGIYTWNSQDFYISSEDGGKRVQVHVKATLDHQKGSIVTMLQNVTQIKDPFEINIHYSMHKEQ